MKTMARIIGKFEAATTWMHRRLVPHIGSFNFWLLMAGLDGLCWGSLITGLVWATGLGGLLGMAGMAYAALLMGVVTVAVVAGYLVLAGQARRVKEITEAQNMMDAFECNFDER